MDESSARVGGSVTRRHDTLRIVAVGGLLAGTLLALSVALFAVGVVVGIPLCLGSGSECEGVTTPAPFLGTAFMWVGAALFFASVPLGIVTSFAMVRGRSGLSLRKLRWVAVLVAVGTAVALSAMLRLS